MSVKIHKVMQVTDSMIFEFHRIILDSLKAGNFKRTEFENFSYSDFCFQFCSIPLKENRALVFSRASVGDGNSVDFLVFSSKMCIYEAEELMDAESFSQKFKKYLESKFLEGALFDVSNLFNLENNFSIKVIQYQTVDITYQMMEDFCKNHISSIQCSQGQSFLLAGGAVYTYYPIVNLSSCCLRIKLATYGNNIDNLKHNIYLNIRDNSTGNLSIGSAAVHIGGELNPLKIASALDQLVKNKDSMWGNIFEMMKNFGRVINLNIPMVSLSSEES